MNLSVPTTATRIFQTSTHDIRGLDKGGAPVPTPPPQTRNDGDNASSFATSFGIRASMPRTAVSPTSTSLRLDVASDAAQRVARPDVTPCTPAITQARLREGRQCTDRVLEVVGVRWESATS